MILIFIKQLKIFGLDYQISHLYLNLKINFLNLELLNLDKKWVEFFIINRYIFLAEMEEQDIKEETSMIYFLIIFNQIRGPSINTKISLQIQEMVILCLFLKIKFIYLEDGIINLNIKTYLFMILKLKCGLILKLELLYLLGIIQLLWFNLSQHGNTLFLEDQQEIFLKDLLEICLHLRIKLIFLIENQENLNLN